MTPAKTQPTSEQAAPPFEAQVQDALSRLQGALSAAVETLPEFPRRAPDLARLLGLERNLAWKLFRLMTARDVFVAARFVPGTASIDAFIAAGVKAGIAPALLERVRSAAAEHAGVVRTHAGDRVSADIMLSVKSGEAGEVALRRAAFRSASYLAGVQAQAQLQTFIFAPAQADPERLDGVSIKGFVDLTRMRPDAPVVISKSAATDDRHGQLRPFIDEPLDGPLPQGEHVPLLREFCSSPLPQFRRVPGEHGFVEDELVEGPVGKTGAATFMTGNLLRSFASRYADEHNRRMDMVTRVRTPTAVVVCDILAHSATFNDAAPHVAAYSDVFGDSLRRGPGKDRYSVPSAIRVEHLGRGPGAGVFTDIPRYTRLLQHVMERAGWNGSDFDVHRVRIEFPFTPTSIVVSFDLLSK